MPNLAIDLSDLTSLREEVRREIARRSLLEFTLYTKPQYLAGWFNKILCRRLDQFLEDVVAHKAPRLMIMAPPRHGKTEIVSRRMPAYAFGKYPDISMIATSYASDLASSINRDIQRIIDDPIYHELFPDTNLWGSNIRTVADGSYLRNSDIFEIVNHFGVYKSAGVGAGVTGRGGDILLIDDPVKDAAEAHSQVVRDGIWEWYTSTLYTRAMPGAGILLIMTRWHEDDLAGRILENMRTGGEQWETFKFPAIAEEDEYDREDGSLLRKAGEALHPERYSLEMLERIKSGTKDSVGLGSRVFTSLYQQAPSAASGNIFKRENWKWIKSPDMPPSAMTMAKRRQYFYGLGITRIIQRWDTALGEKKQADFSACVTIGVAQSRYYVLDVWKGQLEFPEVKRQVQLLYDAWLPAKVCVEGGGSASGKAIVQAMKRDARVPVYEVITATDKVLRAETISPHQEAGFIYFFEGESWTAEFIDQCSGFPNIKNDDDVDAFVGGMEECIGTPGPMTIPDELFNISRAMR